MSETLYRLNTSGLSSEDFGGEMVAVNFETGQYYGINGAAVALWTLLHQPMSKAAATQRIREIYTAIPEHVAHDVNSFFEELIKQGLLLSGSAGDLDVQAEPVSSDALTPLAGTAYVAPSIEIYSDLQELIMLDPVHEADPEQGWPLRREDVAATGQAASKPK